MYIVCRLSSSTYRKQKIRITNQTARQAKACWDHIHHGICGKVR